MKIRPLILDDGARAEIARVMAHAEREKTPLEETIRRARGEIPTPYGDDPEFVCHILVGYRCCFTLMEQPQPIGWTRQLSVSVSEKGCAPGIEPMLVLAQEFGFDVERGIHFFLEEEVEAINFVQPLDPAGRQFPLAPFQRR